FATASTDAGAFEKDLLGDVIPFAEKLYRISGKSDERAIAGLSMGGGQALSIGLHHLDLFHAVGAFSAGIRNQNIEEEYPATLADPAATDQKLKFFVSRAAGQTVCLQRPKHCTAHWRRGRSGTCGVPQRKGMSGATGGTICRTLCRVCSASQD